MPKLSLRTLASGPRQLVVQEALEMMWCAAGSYRSSLTPITMVMSSSGGGGGDQDLLGAGVDVLLRVGGLGEEAGGLDDDVHAQLAPGQLGGVALGQDLDGLAVDDDVAVLDLDAGRQAAGDGVVLEQVGERLGAGEVVDRDDLQVCALCQGGAEVVAADPAEAVDANTSSHVFSLLGALRAHLVELELDGPTNGFPHAFGQR